MGSEKSDAMLDLLKEFAVLQEIDKDGDNRRNRKSLIERKYRQQRRAEIRTQIKRLGREKNRNRPDSDKHR